MSQAQAGNELRQRFLQPCLRDASRVFCFSKSQTKGERETGSVKDSIRNAEWNPHRQNEKQRGWAMARPRGGVFRRRREPRADNL